MDPNDQNAEPGADAPEPVIEATEPPADTPAEAAAAEGAEGEATPAEPQPEAPKHKVPVSVQKRIDKLTYDAKSADERAAAAEARAAAAEALLAANGSEIPAPETPAGKPTDVETAAAQLVAARDFDQKCNTAFAKGTEQFAEQWDESLGMLRALGVMQVPFVQAAMATAAPEKVLHALGQDPDEAVRIASLPLYQQGVEMERLATRLAKPPAPQISKVPAPINTLDGSGKAAPDIYDPNLSDDDYYAIREKERAAAFAGGR